MGMSGFSFKGFETSFADKLSSVRLRPLPRPFRPVLAPTPRGGRPTADRSAGVTAIGRPRGPPAPAEPLSQAVTS